MKRYEVVHADNGYAIRDTSTLVLVSEGYASRREALSDAHWFEIEREAYL